MTYLFYLYTMKGVNRELLKTLQDVDWSEEEVSSVWS
jgi:hypothetical protein